MSLDRRHLLTLIAATLTTFAGGDALASKRGRRGRDDDDDDDDHQRGRQERGGHDDDRGHREAVKALKSGDVVALREILDEVRKNHPGDIVGIKFEKKKERWVYEIKMVTPDDRYLEIYMDARTKEVVKIEGK